MKITIAILLSAFALSSCNTFIGFARDMRQAADGLEKTAHGHKGGDNADTAAPTY